MFTLTFAAALFVWLVLGLPWGGRARYLRIAGLPPSSGLFRARLGATVSDLAAGIAPTTGSNPSRPVSRNETEPPTPAHLTLDRAALVHCPDRYANLESVVLEGTGKVGPGYLLIPPIVPFRFRTVIDLATARGLWEFSVTLWGRRVITIREGFDGHVSWRQLGHLPPEVWRDGAGQTLLRERAVCEALALFAPLCRNDYVARPGPEPARIVVAAPAAAHAELLFDEATHRLREVTATRFDRLRLSERRMVVRLSDYQPGLYLSPMRKWHVSWAGSRAYRTQILNSVSFNVGLGRVAFSPPGMSRAKAEATQQTAAAARPV